MKESMIVVADISVSLESFVKNIGNSEMLKRVQMLKQVQHDVRGGQHDVPVRHAGLDPVVIADLTRKKSGPLTGRFRFQYVDVNYCSSLSWRCCT